MVVALPGPYADPTWRRWWSSVNVSVTVDIIYYVVVVVVLVFVLDGNGVVVVVVRPARRTLSRARCREVVLAEVVHVVVTLLRRPTA